MPWLVEAGFCSFVASECFVAATRHVSPCFCHSCPSVTYSVRPPGLALVWTSASKITCCNAKPSAGSKKPPRSNTPSANVEIICGTEHYPKILSLWRIVQITNVGTKTGRESGGRRGLAERENKAS